MARNKYPEQTERLILDVAEKLFFEKGYETTTIQDIIQGLGGYSKGAVYHHFQSKEEILKAVEKQYGERSLSGVRRIRDDARLNGHEKLKEVFRYSFETENVGLFYSLGIILLNNPRILSMHIQNIFEVSVPRYIQPIVEEGIKDGSIQTAYPKELSESLILLSNLWLNPLIMKNSVKTMMDRARFYDALFQAMGLRLFDEDIFRAYERYCTLALRER